MGVADFVVLLGVVQRFRSFINDLLSPSSAAFMSRSNERLMCSECPDCFGAESSVRCMERGGGASEMDRGWPLRSGDSCCQATYGSGGAGGQPCGGKGCTFPTSDSMNDSPMSRSGSNKAAHLTVLQQPSSRFSSPQALHCSAVRVEDEDEESARPFFTPINDQSQDLSDTDSMSISTGYEPYSFRSTVSSPFDSPIGVAGLGDITPRIRRNGSFDQYSPSYLQNDVEESHDLHVYSNGCADDHLVVDHSREIQHPQPLDLENNRLIWCPPPPEDEGDDAEMGFISYEDEDDDVGESGKLFAPSDFGDDALGLKEKPSGTHKESLWTAVHGHFRALVAELLKGEGIGLGNEKDGAAGWLEVASSLAWQAANFVKPDTRKGGSMDPSNYVKVKCIASGNPRDSDFIKGIVCSKNLKHKRMVSQHKNPRLLLLGGALEYQKVPNKLASINTILEQEKEHLKMIIGVIESHRPNVLLVEKSVSPYAQEILTRDISLVLNVKRSLLDRISLCSGAQIASSIDNISSTRLGHCEMFRMEKFKEFSSADPKKKSFKTLMFFEGCPRRLGCTVLLRGPCREELKKVKHAVQLAVFAAYHLLLETSFLADEGATVPKIPSRPTMAVPQNHSHADTLASGSSFIMTSANGFQTVGEKNPGIGPSIKSFEDLSPSSNMFFLHEDISGTSSKHGNLHSSNLSHSYPLDTLYDGHKSPDLSFIQTDTRIHQDVEVLENHWCPMPRIEHQRTELDDQNEFPNDYFSSADNHQSILVSLSSTCIVKGTVCERSQFYRIRFYGSFDKPLGRYLLDDLFDQTSCCPCCKEPAEAHIRCYTHQQGSLSISVRRLPSVKLPGELDGRIWMWHRCLKCDAKDGVPPATRRVIMSDAAWGLSFGKFLELSFSNHATANRIASCGHSLQRDCLRFYGFGSMVACFRYSPVDIMSVDLPPSVLDFTCQIPQEWVRNEAVGISRKIETLHAEVSDALCSIERNITFPEEETLMIGINRHIIELKDLLKMERNEYDALMQPIASEDSHPLQRAIDILELNRLRRGLLLDAYIWDHRLCYVHSLSKSYRNTLKTDPTNSAVLSNIKPVESGPANLHHETSRKSWALSGSPRKSPLAKQSDEGSLPLWERNINNAVEMNLSAKLVEGYVGQVGLHLLSGLDIGLQITESSGNSDCVEKSPSSASSLSDKIDSAWTGSSELVLGLPEGSSEADRVRSLRLMENPRHRKAISPVRIHSFDSTLKYRDRERIGLSSTSLHLSSVKSVDSFGNFTSLLRDQIPNMRRAYSHRSPRVVEKINTIIAHTPVYISSACLTVGDGARLLAPQTGLEGIVVAIYDDEPTSIISYAMTTREYADYVGPTADEHISSNRSDHAESCSYGSDGCLHFRLFFDDATSFPADKARFSVTCYFAKQFDALRKKCCPNAIDYIRSLSRCKRWSARGGKSNVYFAKTLDERFIIKQVTKTELDSFEDFAPQYFKYLTESLSSGSPTCLAKVVGLYQVAIKSLSGGREVKMDFMVMENLFFRRKILRIYDLKGSLRSRYNPDTSGHNNVLLDMNLLEALNTKPIFLGRKAKRRLERAVWNDTSFLASVYVMDYSLLVGIDEEKKELVVGIIDFMRQYTWDKKLETWVKASGILGGPTNISPTIISPSQYKKRFRKAMSQYFVTVPDQWTS